MNSFLALRKLKPKKKKKYQKVINNYRSYTRTVDNYGLLEKWKYVNVYSSDIFLDYDDLEKNNTNIVINNGVLQPGCYEDQNQISKRKYVNCNSIRVWPHVSYLPTYLFKKSLFVHMFVCFDVLRIYSCRSNEMLPRPIYGCCRQ